jgi:hypothetical protein
MLNTKFIFNGKEITIYKDYCDEFKMYRYSYSIGKTHHNGGFGENNEILYQTEFSAILSAIEQLTSKEDFKIIKREFLIDSIL